MTKNEIIDQLFRGKNFNDCISKMEPAHLRDDLKQEVVMVVCEWPDEKVTGLFRDGKLEFYVVKVIINMLTNKYSSFYKTYRASKGVFVDELAGDEVNADDFQEVKAERIDREMREELEDYTLSEIDNLYWYDAALVRLYMKLGTFRAIQEHTGIPHVSCFKTIKKALVILKRKATEEPAARAVPLFTREELKAIQSGPPMTGFGRRDETKNIRE